MDSVLQRLIGVGLKVKTSKCQLVQPRVNFVGHQVNEGRVGTDPKKVSAVIRWPTPQIVGKVRGILGMCENYRRFVLDFTAIAKPLSELTEKNKGQEQQGGLRHAKPAVNRGSHSGHQSDLDLQLPL